MFSASNRLLRVGRFRLSLLCHGYSNRPSKSLCSSVSIRANPFRADQTLDTIWEGALAAAKRTEDEIGIDNLGPWSDFDWGMINGKLSALRWILGDEWDMLDT